MLSMYWTVEQKCGVGADARDRYIAVSTHMLVHKPSELSWEQCAAIPEVRLPFSLR